VAGMIRDDSDDWKENVNAKVDGWREVVSEWQTIESAPKNGTSFLAVNGNWYVVCHWHRGVCAWCSSGPSYDMIPRDELPTHWMPLPAAPATEKAREGGVK
jgi:hypothetical protein